ncbi:unnamed protein product [Cylicocyclus nassatus]|uniref:Uncharacterized protein n=1 Tax=Cylicocyclus nassatus TaxID=53992 RepID=A0AA36M1E1_CYLNA|nr:unnamed protein product [Cylicocyclus nassatus]
MDFSNVSKDEMYKYARESLILLLAFFAVILLILLIVKQICCRKPQIVVMRFEPARENADNIQSRM